jgi:hypothetical protein
LRLAIDGEQATVLDGGAADLAKLITATENLIRLLPGRELPELKSADGGPNDPRTIMWENYLAARRRGDLAGDENSFDFQRRRRLELEAEVAALKAGAPAPGEPSATPPAPAAPGGNVVPMPRGPTNERTTDRSVVSKPPPAAASAAPEEEYEDVVVTEAVLGEPPAWKNFISSDGSIMSTPGKRWWGPVGS